MALQPQADGTFLGHTSAAYGNLVGPCGGVTAAQALNAVLHMFPTVPEQMADEGGSFARMLVEPAVKEAFGACMDKRKPDFTKL